MCASKKFHFTMVLFLSTVLALTLAPAGLALFLLSYFIARGEEPENTPNGSMGWPLCGETLPFLKPHRSNSMGSFLQDHCSRYGRVFKSHLFGSPAIVSCDHELNMFILQNEEKLFQTSYPKSVNGVLGKNSLLIVSGELHKKLRNVAVSFISASKSTPRFLHSVQRLTIALMESWKGAEEIVFHEEIRKFTLNVMVKNLLSIEPEEQRALNILQDFQTYMKGFVSLPVTFPGSSYSKAVKARERLSCTVRRIIKEREKRNEEHAVNGPGGDFLDEILSKRRLSHEEIVSIVLDLLLGGYETTSTLLALIAYFLGQDPTAFQTLKEEHEGIRKGKDDGEPLDWEDYQKMDFTNNVIYEAMRCGNVVKFVHRKALKDVKYKGYVIPSGWKVLPVFTGAHFDPSLHENPLEFNPWRWNNDKAMTKKVMPFGGGPRLCPGAELAKVEIAFFIHHLVLSYRWKVKGDDFPVAYPYVEFRRGLLLEIEATQ